MEISLKIASISLVFSLVALVWNIARDIIFDRIKLNLRLSVGETIRDDKNKSRFITAGVKITDHGISKKIVAEKIYFRITNIGRKDIEIDCIRAEYDEPGQILYLPIDDKRYLKPYESTNASTENLELKNKIKMGKIKSIYVLDTKNKKWNFDRRDIKDIAKLFL